MTTPSAAAAPSVAVANSIWGQIRSSRSVSDDQLSILHFLFGKNFERATRIVDQGGVRRITGNPSGRFLFLVVGESRRKEEYICFPEHHCTCYSFFYDIVSRSEQLCCKHQLAVLLAEAVGVHTEETVSDERLAFMLSKL
ncbi:zinc finger SWIM domain-containing protein 7-like isoform X4 [Asparagus officinalis]|uniref:zinc finger SWIM domain-containing protein 7-like isoform X4 n=1 Tax=Asparagus officinalis TaxID=4686 RepID=UPI00098E511C|nr:zinc finger SWIM domain-containing protein 7-like isoform X4 [Asparagus officinalis]